ncbi:MAG TPA: protein kinase [Labilithrix sp.]|nr:protein kinase [Labilithrix sp.]
MNALEPGSTLGGYRILARLRAGSMGVLYLARRAGHAAFSRPVAIKVIHEHLALEKRFARMFVDEAILSARIDDPNVVRVEEFGQDAGRYYLVMEYVHGASLAQTIGVLRTRGRIPVEHAVAIAMQIAGGLHGAHEATDEAGKPLGIVHRDVSPHNVLVSFSGTVRVIDFGIAKAREVGGQTKTGSLRGKLAYMPPEQARSARTVDRRADLYGVGLILWEMLTFRRVFDADSDLAILNQIRDPQILPPSALAPAVPRALDDVVMRTLANDPNDRPASGAALQRALAEAVPASLLVLPGDLAALMKKVSAAAEALAGGDDDAALYGDEVKGIVATFAGTMHDSVAQADQALAPRASRPELDGPPSAPRSAPARMVSPAAVVEDETTMRRGAPVRPAAGPSLALRPSDGVRPLMATASPSSPDPGRPSHVELRPSSAEVASAAPPPGLPAKQKVILAVGVPVVTGLVIAAAVILGGQGDAPVQAAPRPVVRDAAPATPPPLVAPVVIAPPVPTEEPDAAPPTTPKGARPRSSGAR